MTAISTSDPPSALTGATEVHLAAVGHAAARLPRVLAVLPGVPDGPGFIFSKRQVRALHELGTPVTAFFIPSRQSPVALVRAWWHFRREVRAVDPDVVHAHFGTMLAFLCAISTRRPLVITFRGSDLNPVPSISRLRSATGKLLSQLAAARAARIICVSQQLKERLWWRTERATVIPNGVETREFFPRPRDEARARLGWDLEERVVLFNGGMFPRVKRLDLAAAAVDAARQLCGPIRLEVLDGHTDGSLVPTLMSAADCLIVTSDWEGSPDIVKEAMACNLPIVSVDVGDVSERLAGVHPSCIADREPEALGRGLATILASRERSNGRAIIQELAMERVAARVLAELQAAAAGAVRP